MNITIRIITENKKDFLPLLLLGDELESDIDKYLERGELFALYTVTLKACASLRMKAAAFWKSKILRQTSVISGKVTPSV